MKLPEMDDKRKRNLLIIFAVMFLVGLWLVWDSRNEPVKVSYYPTFKTLIKEKKFAEVSIAERGSLYGKIRPGTEATVTEQGKTLKLGPGAVVTTPTPYDPKLLEVLEASGTKYTYVLETGGFFSSSMFSILLTVGFFIFIFWFLNRQVGRGGRDAAQFTKNKAKLISNTQVPVTFKDVAGINEALEDAADLVLCLKEPKKFTRLGGRIPKGVLLTGPPGVGKTHLARAVAGEAGVPFYSISGSDFIEMFVGVGAARVRDLFEQAKKNSPCIIFIDEIDALGRHRGAGIGGGNDEREQTLNQLLVEMDGFDKDSGVIMVAATNRPDILDPALTRAGRFDKKIVVPRPDIVGREAILRVHASKVPMENPDDVKIIAKMAIWMVGSDLENIVNEAALIAARKDHEKVTLADLNEAYLSQRLGKERKSHKKSELEREITAYHEAGHAVVAKILGRRAGVRESVGKVTILERGESAGSTWVIPDEQKMVGQENQLKSMIMVNMGGRVAETLKYGEVSAGASGDIRSATGTATRMVTTFGMSKLLGPVALGGEGGGMPFVGAHMGEGGAGPSQDTRKNIDKEVRSIITEAESKSLELLTKYRPVLEATAKLLMDKETIDGEEIDPFIDECEVTLKS